MGGTLLSALFKDGRPQDVRKYSNQLNKTGTAFYFIFALYNYILIIKITLYF